MKCFSCQQLRLWGCGKVAGSMDVCMYGRMRPQPSRSFRGTRMHSSRQEKNLIGEMHDPNVAGAAGRRRGEELPVPNTGGSVRVYGKQGFSKADLGRIGWVPQAAANLPSHIRITVRELVRLGTLNAQNMFKLGDSGRGARVNRALEMVGMSDKADTDVSQLSGGQLQRSVIARALASEADFLLLDEPLVGVDLLSRNSLMKLLDDLCHKENKTVLMVSHDLTTITQAAHRIIYLEGSVRFDGSSDEVPDFSSLASLRGIQHVHDPKHSSHGHNK